MTTRFANDVEITGSLRVTGYISDSNAYAGMAKPSGEVYDIEPQILADLWLAKYGGDWVSRDTVQSDTFFCTAAQRLRYKYLEAAMSNGKDYWYRVRK